MDRFPLRNREPAGVVRPGTARYDLRGSKGLCADVEQQVRQRADLAFTGIAFIGTEATTVALVVRFSSDQGRHDIHLTYPRWKKLPANTLAADACRRVIEERNLRRGQAWEIS